MSYDMIDRLLRNSLGDDEYAEYSAALISLQSENEELKVRLTRSGIELLRAVFAERKRCAEWVQNNYQEHASIAMLCDAMRLRINAKES